MPDLVKKLIVNPQNEHKEFLSAIKAARKSIRMKMFHLSDPQVIAELKNAKARNVDVKVILDSSSLLETKFHQTFTDLRKSGVNARASSNCFSVTHEKSMLIDDQTAFITSINLTKTVKETRDYGVVTDAPDILSDMSAVFEADWKNAEKNTCMTPKLSSKYLLWSPTNSEEKLISLIKSAQNTIYATVENLGNKKIENALIERATQGVDIRLIVPQCDKNKNPFLNYPFITKLEMGNVHVNVMPHPSSGDRPYMHSKMILVDEALAYIGSENFSNNSLHKARELGIVFGDSDAIETIKNNFAHDWKVSIAPVAPSKLKKGFCPEI